MSNKLFIGKIYTFFPDSKGNTNNRLLKYVFVKKRLDGRYTDITTKEIYSIIPRQNFVRGIYISDTELIDLNTYLDYLYSEGFITEKKANNKVLEIVKNER